MIGHGRLPKVTDASVRCRASPVDRLKDRCFTRGRAICLWDHSQERAWHPCRGAKPSRVGNAKVTLAFP